MEGSEVIVGAKAIGEAIGVKTRRVHLMIDKGEIPVFRLGGSIAMRRSTLNSWISSLEAASLSA
ncbi:hypothetical protein DSM25558_5113 [Agrobacterium sp. DSM 25558]|uniref:DNA-binding protein n=1 Tax=Agrobacterium sp. DSM 25558 TaxID=1907665 RepID=UPI0009725085|nr:DNA-binding protein [Agrobacterium sp. DSM 25558]SCX31077.1 hypothetical protein DSM25558_5113 [Agrobacterium sp. DSM 25558]